MASEWPFRHALLAPNRHALTFSARQKMLALVALVPSALVSTPRLACFYSFVPLPVALFSASLLLISCDADWPSSPRSWGKPCRRIYLLVISTRALNKAVGLHSEGLGLANFHLSQPHLFARALVPAENHLRAPSLLLCSSHSQAIHATTPPPRRRRRRRRQQEQTSISLHADSH
jgi:hypothetical protein